jgi:hypothetical protein
VMKGESDNRHASSREGFFAAATPDGPDGRAHRQPWRTEPEIGPTRQEQLLRRLATTPDVRRGIYPFKGMKLARADIEWLLAAHENGRDRSAGDGEQRLDGWRLDLRGADLRYADLHALPLARLLGSLTREERAEATEEQCAAAEVLLTGVDLSEAHLEEGYLSGAYLQDANLAGAHRVGHLLVRPVSTGSSAVHGREVEEPAVAREEVGCRGWGCAAAAPSPQSEIGLNC